jgi:hypothetical protein
VTRREERERLGREIDRLSLDVAAEHRLLTRQVAAQLEANGIDVGDKMRPLRPPGRLEQGAWKRARYLPHDDPAVQAHVEHAWKAKRLRVRRNIGEVLALH